MICIVLMSYSKSSRGKSGIKTTLKTYNSRDSLMVTHLTTNPPVSCLNRAERTGSLVFMILWSYVQEVLMATIYIRGQNAQSIDNRPLSCVLLTKHCATTLTIQGQGIFTDLARFMPAITLEYSFTHFLPPLRNSIGQATFLTSPYSFAKNSLNVVNVVPSPSIIPSLIFILHP